MKKVAISVGDLNGVGIEIALKAHKEITEFASPIYLINQEMLERISKLLNLEIPTNFRTKDVGEAFDITPSVSTKESGMASYLSFLEAVDMAKRGKVDAIVTLPINKEAWAKAAIPYKGHTDMLDAIFKKSDAIMMIGSPKLYAALFTHHIPLKNVATSIKKESLCNFLISLYNSIQPKEIAVLGLNPHAGDGGVLGDEERIIQEAIDEANRTLNKEIFIGPLVPDTAFTPAMRERFNYFVAMYHDQGLIPVKTLYFDESINVTLNLPIIRTSVDHGTAYDIAYKNKNPSTQSYINAVKEAVRLSSLKRKNVTDSIKGFST